MNNDQSARARLRAEAAPTLAQHRRSTMDIFYDTNARALGVGDPALSSLWEAASHAALALRDALERIESHLRGPEDAGAPARTHDP